METDCHRSRKANNCYNEFQQNKTNNKVSVCMLIGYIHSNYSRKISAWMSHIYVINHVQTKNVLYRLKIKKVF